MKTGVLLINLGTPDSPSTADVRKYLTQFLNDPRVIDINPIGRFLLVSVSSDSQIVTIDSEGLFAKGIYLVTASSTNALYSKKLIIK